MRHTWLNLCLVIGAGCSTVAPLDETGETGAESMNPTAPSGGSEDAGGTGSPMTPTTGGADESTTFPDPAPTDVTAEGTTIEVDVNTGSTGMEATSGDTGILPGDGCGLDPGPTGVQMRMLEVMGTPREYMVVVPDGYDANTPLPVVFAWHGLGGDGALARLYFGIEEASAGAAIFVYPDGLPQADQMDQSGWNLMENGEDVAFFDAMLADVQATLCVDAARVFSAGHSFGGYMSNSIGCFRGGTVRAIAPVAGGGPFWACTGQVAAWIAHGTMDMVVPFTQGEMSRDLWTAANNCDVTMPTDVDPAPCVAYAGCDDGFPVHWCQHDIPDFMGHTWPAWAGAGIWGFFAGF